MYHVKPTPLAFEVWAGSADFCVRVAAALQQLAQRGKESCGSVLCQVIFGPRREDLFTFLYVGVHGRVTQSAHTLTLCVRWCVVCGCETVQYVKAKRGDDQTGASRKRKRLKPSAGPDDHLDFAYCFLILISCVQWRRRPLGALHLRTISFRPQARP